MEGGASIDTKTSKFNTNTNIPAPDPEPKKDDTLIINAIKSNYIRLNRELFYVQELLNSNTSWELEHRVTTGANMKIRGIFTEDEVAFSISNTFGEGGMNDTVEGKAMNFIRNAHDTVSSHAATYNTAPKIGHMIGNAISTGARTASEFLGGDGIAGMAKRGFEALGEGSQNLFGKVSDFVGKAKDFVDKFGVDRIMNSKFIAATDLVKTFQGSSTKFNLPTLKCWIFHNSQGGGEDKSNLSEETNNVKSMVKAIVSTCIGEVKDLEGVMGLQYSPGEYRPELQAINMSKYYKDMGFHGTWNLTMGGYTIYNLLIDNIDVSLSKFNAMNRNGGDSGDPLYAELSISLTPASYVSKDDLFHTYDKRGKTSNKINWRTDNNKSNPAPKVENSTYRGGGSGSRATGPIGPATNSYGQTLSDAEKSYNKSVLERTDLTKEEKRDLMANMYTTNHPGCTRGEAILATKQSVNDYGGMGICKVNTKWYQADNWEVVDVNGKTVETQSAAGYHTLELCDARLRNKS